LIYRTLIGQLPWDVGTTTALLRAHQYTEPEPLPPVEGMPSAVSALIARCLEKRPADRPSSAELAHVLGTVSAGVPAARAYVPDWAENGEDTTILPSARRDTDSFGRVRPGLAQVHSAAPGRGVAAVPAAEAPVSPAPTGTPVPPAVSVAEVEAAVGPVSSPPQRGARNSRFGPVPPAPAVASAAAPAPPVADAGPAGPALRPAFGGDGALRPPPREERPPAPAARPGGGNTPPARPGGGGPPHQNRPGAAASGPAGPGRNGGTTQRRRVLILSGSIVGAVLLASAAVAALSQDAVPKTPNAGSTTLTGSNKCVVSYAVWEDKNNRFRAAITLANRDNTAIKDWKLWFMMPGDQVVSGNGGVKLNQQGQGVTVLGRSPLSPQQTKTLEFTGRYKASNAAPMVFELGGDTCQTFVSPAPGAPSRPVEHLTNGSVRLGPVPTKDSPIPGISINPGGVAVPVPVNTTVPAGGTTPATTPAVVVNPGGGTGTGGDDDDDDETPVEPSAPTTTPAVTTTTTAPVVTETTPAVTDTFTDPGDGPGNEPLPEGLG
ncbi:cellulose binding domain-containing protein, partial [Actinoplanes auranticolor]